MLLKNTAQKIHVYAYDSTTGAAKTGDAANITGYVSLDGTANAIDDTNPAEVDATNMPGVYAFDLTAAETNCDSFALVAKSSTANIRLDPIIGYTTAGSATAIAANAIQVLGTALTETSAGYLAAAFKKLFDVATPTLTASLLSTAQWAMLTYLLDGTTAGSVVDDNDPDPTTLLFETDLAEATNDHYNGAYVVFYSGALKGQSRKISDYDGTSKVLTVATAFTEAPAAGDDFLIIGRSE